MRYSQWRAFDAVARELSFSKAASRLRVTQPAVTLQVRALEEACGMTLLERAHGKIQPTDQGRSLLALTNRMFTLEEEIREFLTSAKQLKRGLLRLGADGPAVALDLVAIFQKRYPGVTIQMILGNAEETWQNVLGDKVDAAILCNPVPHDLVRIIPIGRQGMIALLPKGHALSNKSRLTLKELQGERVILREIGSNTRRTLDAALRQHGITFSCVLELGSREAVRDAVARGFGIGFAFDREAIGDDRSISIPIESLESSALDTLVFRHSQAERVVVRALTKLVGLFERASTTSG